MINKTEAKKSTPKGIILKFFVLIIYISVLIVFYNLLKNVGANPFVVVIVLVFVFLITIGPFLKRNKKSLYSRMFPDKKKRIALNTQRRRDKFKIGIPRQPQPNVFKQISLDFKYNTPLISKCENCKNILPKFVKKCPFCGKLATT
ncbi:MAG: hypothetical protein ACW98D_07065 [Promethearchaeota archaeon]|jgi:hypothetical protein